MRAKEEAMGESVSRREFFGRTGLVAGAGLAVAGRAAAQAPKAVASSDPVVLGLVGCGGRGQYLMQRFLQAGQARFAVVCDPDSRHAAEAQAKAGPGVEAVKDFRRVLDRQDVEAVVVATPDHWHAIPTIQACQAGKDVYVEKPVAHDVAECRAMIEAKNRAKRIVAVGLQQRSGAHFQEAVAIVQSGLLGPISRVNTWNRWNASPGASGSGRNHWIGNPPDGEPPEGVDYDLWLGPAPKRPFNPNRFHFNYIFFWDYAGGMMTGWQVHLIDVVHWAMRVDAPTSVYCTGGKYVLTDNRETPDTQEAICTYPGWVGVYSISHANAHCLNFGRDHGISFHGSRGTLVLDRSGFEVIPESERMASMKRGSSAQDEPHVADFVACVRSRKEPAATLEAGVSATLPTLLANISVRTGRLLAWDAKASTISGDAEAAGMLKRTYREPWHL